MRKIYSLFLATAVAAVATAGVPAQKSADVVKFNTAKVSANPSIAERTVKGLAGDAVPQAVTITSIDDIAGNYVWQGTSAIGQSNPDQEIYISVTDAAKGEVAIEGISYSGMANVKATFDVATQTLSIPNKQLLGSDEDGPLYLYFKSVNSEGKFVAGASADADVKGEFKDGVFTFPAMSVWAFGDPDNETIGWYFATYANKFYDPSVAPKIEYTERYKGQMTENTASYLFLGTETENYISTTAYEVDVFTDKDLTSVAINDAWKGMYEALEIESVSPVLVINVKTPTNCKIEEQGIGINAGSSVGTISVGSSYGYIQGATAKIKMSNLGNIYTITMPVKSTYVSGSAGSLWWGNLYAATTIKFVVKDDGVSSVNTDGDTAEKEYYNLQGIRVTNPESGLHIVRQGSKVSKVIL